MDGLVCSGLWVTRGLATACHADLFAAGDISQFGALRRKKLRVPSGGTAQMTDKTKLITVMPLLMEPEPASGHPAMSAPPILIIPATRYHRGTGRQ